jgi:uncharacterized protein YqfA (UPF0365 family)
MDSSSGVLILVAVFAAIIIFFVFLYFVPVGLWIRAVFSNVKVGLFDLVFMRIRKVPPRYNCRIINYCHKSRP